MGQPMYGDNGMGDDKLGLRPEQAAARTALALERIAHTLERIENEFVTYRRDTTHMLSRIESAARAKK